MHQVKQGWRGGVAGGPMTRLAAVLLVMTALSAAQPAVAAGRDRSDYYLVACRAALRDIDAGRQGADPGSLSCLVFTEAAVAANAFLSVYWDAHPTYCLPAGTPFERLMRSWVGFLERAPQALDWPPIRSFVIAMEQAFPCAEHK